MKKVSKSRYNNNNSGLIEFSSLHFQKPNFPAFDIKVKPFKLVNIVNKPNVCESSKRRGEEKKQTLNTDFAFIFKDAQKMKVSEFSLVFNDTETCSRKLFWLKADWNGV